MTTRSRLLLESAIRVLRGEVGGFSGEVHMKAPDTGIDNIILRTLKSGFSINQSTTLKENEMARTRSKTPATSTAPEAPAVEAGTPEANTVINHEDGSTETLNPTPVTKQDEQAAAAKAKIQAKADKKAAAEAKKAEKEAAREARNATIRANKEARAERMEKLAEGTERTYLGSMLALSDRVKEGAYVKSGTGQLRSNDELANALDLVPVDNVIKLAKIVLKLDENPYTKLNAGQQSMNLRNRMRGAIKKGDFTIADVKAVIEAEGFDTYKGHAEKVVAEKQAKADAKAAKEAAKAKAAEKEPETA